MKLLSRVVLAAVSAAFFMAAAQAQNAGTVTQHAFAVGKGAGAQGYASLLCASAQLAVGQSAADPICQTITGDVTINASGVTALGNIPNGTPLAGSLLTTAIGAPGTPSAGKDSIWIDSTDKRLHEKNDAGTIGTTVVSDTGAPNNFMTGIGTNGAITKARPACANLSDASVFCNGTNAVNLTGTIGTASVLGTGAASHGTMIDVAGVPTWKTVPDCQDSGGNHLNYAQASDAFSCGSSSSSAGGGGISGTVSVTGASTTYTSAQNTKLVTRSNTGSPMSDTLPGTSPGILPAGTLVTIQNNDTAGVLAINVGSGATLKAQTGSTGYLYVCPGQSIAFFSDGSTYWAVDQTTDCFLKGATTFYGVASGGSATNTGLTSSSPLNSCAAAYSLAQSVFNAGLLNPSTQPVTIQCGTPGTSGQTFGATALSGRIPGQAEVDGQAGIFPVIVQGDTTTPGNIAFSVSGGDALAIKGGASLLVQGFAVSSTPSSGNGIDAIGSHVAIKTINFGTCATNHIDSTHRSFVEIVGNYSLTGTGAGEHWLVSDDSSLYVQSATAINYVTNQTWGTAFLAAQYASNIVFNVQPTYVGTGGNTGPQYSIFLNSVLNTGHGGVACGSAFPATVIPGTAGGCSTGGQIN